MLYYELGVDFRVLYCGTVVVIEIQQIENRENCIFWCGFGFHEDFCIGTVSGRDVAGVVIPATGILSAYHTTHHTPTLVGLGLVEPIPTSPHTATAVRIMTAT